MFVPPYQRALVRRSGLGPWLVARTCVGPPLFAGVTLLPHEHLRSGANAMHPLDAAGREG